MRNSTGTNRWFRETALPLIPPTSDRFFLRYVLINYPHSLIIIALFFISNLIMPLSMFKPIKIKILNNYTLDTSINIVFVYTLF